MLVLICHGSNVLFQILMSVYHRLVLEEHVLTFQGISHAIVQQATDLLQEHVKVGDNFTNIYITWLNN